MNLKKHSIISRFKNLHIYSIQRRSKILLQKLSVLKIAPKNIEVSKISDYFFAAAYDERDHRYISDFAAGSHGKSLPIVMAKSICEYIERKAVIQTSEKSRIYTDGASSTGYAAFPVNYPFKSNAIIRAREKAYMEALERFVFVRWWKDIEVSFSIRNLYDSSKKNQSLDELFKNLSNIIVDRIDIILPEFKKNDGRLVAILIASLEGGGFIVGRRSLVSLGVVRAEQI